MRSGKKISQWAVGMLLARAAAAGAATASWTGGPSADNNWATPGNWLNNILPASGDTVAFDANSTQNLATNNDIPALSSLGITVGAVPGAAAVSIGGNGFGLGAGGIDMSAGGLTQSLTISLAAGQGLNLDASQTWKLFTQATAGSAQNITINSPITGAAGANLTFGVTNNSTGASSTGTFQLLAANTYAGDTVIGGPNISYVIAGNSPFGTGNVNLNSFNTAPQIQTSGTVTLANTMTWNSGFMFKAASTGDLTLNGNITLVGNNASQINRTINNVSNQTITVNGNITTADPNATGNVVKPLLLQASPGAIVVNGLIQDAVTNTVAGTVLKTGTGVATINSTANTYAGQTQIQNGTLEVKLIADAGSVSSIGTGATTPQINLGNTASTGTLRYLGSVNASSNRVLSLAGTTGGGAIDSSGAGTISFTADFAAGGAGVKTFTLTGPNTGANTIGGVIRDQNATNKTSLVKSGTGLWMLGTLNTYTGTTTVNAGTLRLNANLLNSPTVTVAGGTLELASGAGNNRIVKAAATIAVTGTGRLDIQDNKLITGAAVGTFGSSNTYDGITGLIASGRNGGGWTGNGIVTSQSAAASGNLTSIGVATAQQAKGLATTTDTATWAGQTVTGSQTLVMYTYGGDANLDGKVNVDDYGRIDFNVNLGTSGWFNGDFNYDGKINVDDYGIIDFNVGIQGAPFATSSPLAEVTNAGALSAVPEPTTLTLSLTALASTVSLRRRRRRRARRVA